MEWLDKLNAKQRETAEKVRAAARKWGVPENLALAAAMQESSFDQRKKSGTGPVGVMMMGRSASKEMGINPHNEDQNIEGGVRLLGSYLQKYGNPQTALIAYHDGPNSSYFKGGEPSPAAVNHLQKVQSYGGFQGDIPTMAKDDQLPFKLTEVSPVEDITFPENNQDVQFFGRPRNIYDYGAGAAGAGLGYKFGANSPWSTDKQTLELRKQSLALKQLQEANKNVPVAPKTFGQDIGNWVPGQYSQDIALNIRQPSSMEDAAEQARVLETKKRLTEAKFGPTQPARPGSSIVIPGGVPQVPGTSLPTTPELTTADMPASKIGAGRSGWGRAANVMTGGLGAMQLADAYQRGLQGDPVGAAFSGVGGAGLSAGTHITNPKVRAAALGLGGLSSLLGQGYDYLRDKFNITPKQQPEEKAAGGLMSLPKYAGKGESLVRAGKAGKAFLENVFAPRPTTQMRASEALAPHEGKYLGLTQSDNFGVHEGRMGGNQFPNFQNISPEHQKANVVWMNDTKNHANALVENRRFNDKDVVFSTFLGGPDQLKSNKTVFDNILEEHYRRNLTPEQYDLINKRIATAKDNKGKLIFSQPFDIRDRFATQELGGHTFARRGALASMLGEGEGVGRTRSGIALPEYQNILKSHRDPLTEGVPTSSVGTRLFTVDDIPAQFSTEYHPDYNWAVFGKDQGVQFNPVPQNIIVPDWHQAYKAKHPTREPHGNAWFSYPKSPQFIDEKYLTWLQKRGYKDGGLVHLQSGGNPKLAALRAFVDPATKYLKDWNWKPMSEVGQRLDMREVPDYIQGGYGQFMQEQAARAARDELGPRDLIKAYGITQSSIGRGGLPHSTATKAGLRLPNTGGEVRPEGAFAEWLGSRMGQRFLDTAAQGTPDPRALAEIQSQFAPFGKQNQLIDQLRYASQTMPELAKGLNPAITGDKDAYRKWAEQMKGVAGAKSGFIGSMLGRGDLPTFDARQIALHTGNQAPVGIGSIMNRGRGAGGRESVDRLAARQEALGVDIDPGLAPHYQHLTHHAVWDKLGDNKTTHEDIIRAMRDYADGGLVHLQAGGSPKAKALGALTRLGESAYDMLKLTPEKVEAWRKANAKPYKQQQDPMLAQALEAYLTGKIPQEEYLRIMQMRRPIRPLTEVPTAHTNEDIVSALDKSKADKGILGLNLQVPEGMRVGNRLDIPAYERYGVYVDTMHDPSGKPIGYGHTGHLKDVEFKSSPDKAARVGLGTREQGLTPLAAEEGQGKSPFAMIMGSQVNTNDEEVRRMLAEALKDPSWRQIGMNPYRGSQFYDKADMMPVWSAAEKIQAGPLVMARDLEKTDWRDPRLLTKFGKNYKEGGQTGLYANIHAKQERIKHGSGEKMRKPGDPGAPTAEAFRESEKTANLKKGGTPSLSVGRGEKLPVDQGAGLTAKGRAKYNRETGSNLKAPQPEGGPRKDSFCARMEGVVEHAKGDAPRAKASLKRWNC